MPNDVTIRLRADTARAKQNIETLEREVSNLRQRLGETSASARQASAGVDGVGDQAQRTAGQVRTVNTTLESLSARMNDSRRAALTLRDRMNALNSELADNARALLTADGAQKELIQTRNRAIRVNQGLLRSETQRNSAVLAGLTQERRELGGATRATGRFALASQTLAANLATIGIGVVTRGVIDFTRESIGAAVKVEGFRNSLTALYGDAQIASNVLAGLQDLAQLPGITFQSAVMGAVRLKTVGVEGARAEGVIREFGNAAALAGASTDEVGRSLVGFTQILSRGKVSQEELNQILENVPLIGNSIREAFGSIDAETIRDQLDSAGQGVQDFADILVNQLSMGVRASADSARNAFSNLENATFNLQAAIGEALLPTLADATRGFTGFLESITGFLEGNLFATKSAEDFTEAISGTTASVKDLLPELDEYIRRLDQRAANPRGTLSSQELEDLAEAKVLYDLVSGAIDGNTESITQLETRTSAAKTALEGHNAEQERLKAAIEAVDPSIRSERDSLQGLNADLDANAERISAAQGEYDQLNKVFTAVNEETETLRAGIASVVNPTATAAAATDGFSDSIDDFGGALSRVDTRFLTFRERADALSGAIRELPPAITAVRDAFDVLAPTAERVKAIFDDLNTSLVDSQLEINLLDAVTRKIIQDLQDLEALAHVRVVIADRTDVHNANLISQAVSDAIVSFRDYNDVLLEAGINFRSVESISEDVTEAIRDQASAFDDLRGDVDAAEISLDDIDETFDRIPDAIDLSIVSMEDFETVGLRALRAIGDELSVFEGNLGGIGVGIDNLVTLFSNPANFAAGTLGAVIEGLANINQFAGALGLPEGFFDDPVPGQAQVNPQNVAQNEQRAADQVHQAGIARNLNVDDPLAQIEILRENDPGIFQRHGTRGFIEENFPELVDVIYPRTTGASAQYQRGQAIRAGAPTAGQTALAAAREAEANSAAARDAEAAAALSDIPEPDLPGSEAGAADAAAAAESQRRAESSILDTNVGRARFELGRSTDEGDFELDRQTLILSIIAAHAAENARIDALMLGETEIAALRLANDLDRDMALERATTAENTFTTQRIKNEMDVAEAAADAAQAKIDGIEEAAAAAMQAAEEAAAATERQRIADGNAQRSLLGTGVRSARFELGRAGSENEFELDRQTLLLSIVAVHTAEDARIDALMLGEIEIAALRAKNDLARDIAIERAIGLENTFTTQRIENEMNAAEAAADAAQARIDGIEDAAEAAAEAAQDQIEAQQKIAEAAAIAAERQAQRESNAAAGLLQSGVGQARFDLGLSGSEGEFEANRIALINATNAFYDNELANINALELSEIELDDRRTANELKRQMALSRATTLTNSFTTARVRAEQDALDDIEDLRDEAIDAEMDRQRAIDDLRDDALDAERDRADALVDLAQDTQDRILDIQRDANRSREDIAQDFLDDNADLRRAFNEEQQGIAARADRGEISREDAQRQIGALSRGFIEDQGGLVRERDRDLRGLGIRTGRREEDAATRQGRGIRDIDTEAQERLLGIQTETETLRSATAMIESTNAATNAESAMMNSEATQRLGTAAEVSEQAGMALETAGVELQSAARVAGLQEAAIALSGAAAQLGALPAILQEGLTSIALNASAAVVQGVDATLGTIISRATGSAVPAADMLLETTAPTLLMMPAPPMPEMIVDSVSITAGSVNVTGGSVTGGEAAQGNPQSPNGNMVAVFNIDSKEVADAIAVPMGDNLARRQGTRRTVVGGTR